MQEAYKEASASLRQVGTRVASAAVAPAVRKAVETLGAARMIPSAYRWTGKPPPTRPSPYVALAVNQLRDFFSALPLARLLDPNARLDWASEAAAKVTEQYVANNGFPSYHLHNSTIGM